MERGGRPAADEQFLVPLKKRLIILMRYAISLAPPTTSPLWQRGSQWLGRDACNGQYLPPPRFRGIDPERFAELTRTPAHHGFHATIVPPFRLAERVSEADLLQDLDNFAARQRPLSLAPLEIALLSNFFCLRPAGHCPVLQTLAALGIRAFERFRAPLTPGELARGKAVMLSGQEKRNLEIWGYPYVFEEFRFHFTLTTRMPEGREMDLLHNALLETFTPLLSGPLLIDDICLFMEADAGKPMRCLYRFPFPPISSEPEERTHHAPQLLQKNIHPGYQCHSA
jgi:hypothetical protein